MPTRADVLRTAICGALGLRSARLISLRAKGPNSKNGLAAMGIIGWENRYGMSKSWGGKMRKSRGVKMRKSRGVKMRKSRCQLAHVGWPQ